MNEFGAAVVIEDDDDVRNVVEAVLGQAGFDVVATSNGRDGVRAVESHRPAVVTLDIGLPDIDGFEVLRRIRALSDCYVVMLTGHTDEPDTLLALQAGADDYVSKPFRPRELRARIAAMLRRPRAGAAEAPAADADGPPRAPQAVRVQGPGYTYRGQRPSAPPQPAREATAPAPASGPAPAAGPLEHRGLELDPRTRTSRLDGVPLELTRSEFDLLRDLLQSSGGVRTKKDLVRVARGDHLRSESYVSQADERAVEVHIGNIRRKLGEDTRRPRWIQTVRGVGYRLVVDE